jgi:YegS/Rv2252/BmrU family lipid kinase
MARSNIRKLLVIANPAAQSGNGQAVGEFVEAFLSSYESGPRSYSVRYTKGPGDAARIARSSQNYDVVAALGGDGVIHEVVNGLMELPAKNRPALGVIPVGSGNDFARTIDMAKDEARASLGQLLNGTPVEMDLGKVNGVWFMETCSFGLDAAIALDTVERRARQDGRGANLFASSGVKIFTENRSGFKFKALIDGKTRIEGEELVFACQNGPTYGGGFAICPNASITDGALDLCYTVDVPPLAKTLTLFAKARFGKHVKSPYVHTTTFKRLVVEFEEEPPAQVDGEKITGKKFSVLVEPKALRVIVPNSSDYNPERVKVDAKPALMEGLLGTKITGAVKNAASGTADKDDEAKD